MLVRGNHVRSTTNPVLQPHGGYQALTPVISPLRDCPCPGTATDYNARYISMKMGDALPFASGTMSFDIDDLCPGGGFLLQFDNGDCSTGCNTQYSISVVFPSPMIGTDESPYCTVTEFIYDQLVQHPMLSSFISFDICKDDSTKSGQINWVSQSHSIEGFFSAWIDENIGTASFAVTDKDDHKGCGGDVWFAGEPVGRSLDCADGDRTKHFTADGNCCLEFAGFAANSARGGSCSCLRVLATGTTALPWDNDFPLECLTPSATLIYCPESRKYSMMNSRDNAPSGWVEVTTSVKYAGCCKSNPNLRKVTIHGGM
jgi:hypothetical protein